MAKHGYKLDKVISKANRAREAPQPKPASGTSKISSVVDKNNFKRSQQGGHGNK